MPKEDKATNVEMEIRITKVFEYLCKGILSTEMWEYVQQFNPEWNVSRTTVWRYVAEAKVKFSELAEKNKENEFGKSVARLSILFEKSLKIQDYKTCLAIEKERNSLFGLYEPKRLEMKHEGSIGIGLEFKEIYE